uniref:Major facilitator superfamily (MFS) profile domain-containing protein n=1 Tax=Ciona savignyi TaxID=51511 RepID=H2YBM6_CIOSA
MPWTEAKLNRRKSQLDQIQTPPDGGWGWVIVFGSIIAGANFAAISRCYSVFYGSLMREYEVDFASVAWMNGAFQAGYGISCPFAATILNKFGFRSVTMAAGIVMTICTASASLAPHLWQVQLLAGFIPGLCMGQIVISLFTAITRYFAHRRNLATQVLCGGFTMGAFVYCPAYQLMIDSYSWRGALLLISGIFFHITAVGALLRPLILSEDFPPELRNRIRRETKSFENFKLSGAFDPNNNKKANLA